MDRNRTATALLVTTSIVVALSTDGTSRTVAALAAVLATLAGVLREIRTRRA